jgi:alpha-tubulin suppressor-like RCC1 family protein
VLFLAMAMLAGCDDQRATGPEHANPDGASLARVLQNGEFEAPCDETMTVALRNADGEVVGEARIWNGETTAYVRLTAQAAWEFTEVRVGGALQPNQFPRTGGVVDPSRFQFGGVVMPASNEVVIEALHLGNPYGVELGDEVLLSIFVRSRPGDGGPTVDAWAEGTAFRTGEHPMYFRYTVRECEGEPPPPTIIPETISAGGSHSCGLTVSGAAYCWGHNGAGQLGDGTITHRTVPVPVSGGHTFSSISTGLNFTVALTAAGVAYAWGVNFNGQLGNDGGGGIYPTPGAVSGDHTFTSVHVGSAHTIALTAEGAAYAWGNNVSGRLGDGTTTNRYAPVPVLGGHTFVSAGAGGGHSVALTSAGTAYAWGTNTLGQLGDGTTTDRHTPVLVSGGHSFASIGAGGGHAFALTAAGAAFTWGGNSSGELGDGTTTQRRTPVPVSGAHTFTSITGGTYHTVALTSVGAAYAWGWNQSGQLGDGTTAQRLTPVPVSGGHTFQSISAGGQHTLAISGVGAAYSWGSGQYGQLGDGTTASARVTPVPVSGGLIFQ